MLLKPSTDGVKLSRRRASTLVRQLTTRGTEIRSEILSYGAAVVASSDGSYSHGSIPLWYDTGYSVARASSILGTRSTSVLLLGVIEQTQEYSKLSHGKCLVFARVNH